MTMDFFLGQLRLALVALLAYCGGKGWLTPTDSGLATALITSLGPIIGPWLWSVYVNVNGKIVPRDSVAISADHVAGAPIPGTTVMVKQPLVNVVGVLMVALALSFLVAGSAMAQVRKPLTGNIVNDIAAATGKPAPVATSVDGAFAQFNAEVQKITKALIDKAIVDVQAALDDATKHNDAISMPCWQSNLDLLKGLPTQWDNPPTDIGLALGIQIQRDLLNSITGTDAKSLKVACAALWGDQLKIVANVGALIGVRIATGGLL